MGVHRCVCMMSIRGAIDYKGGVHRHVLPEVLHTTNDHY
jgi:hypothetical protein